MVDLVLFAVFPYVAVILAILAGIYRYRSDRFSYSSFSSQFLEGRQLFWGSVPWHYGIIVILLAHLLAALFPRAWAALIAAPTRLYALEVAGLTLALLAIVGLVLLILRRLVSAHVFAVTSAMDWALLIVLLAQVVLGLWVALFYRWGSAWSLSTIVPWVASLVKFHPRLEYVTALPLPVKLHLLGGLFIIALFPFTRLVHLVSLPISYLWRPYQVVWWNRRVRASGVHRLDQQKEAK